MHLMWCLTREEAERWFEGCGGKCGPRGPNIDHAKHAIQESLAERNWAQLTNFSQCLVKFVQPFDHCLLWVTTWGVWRSSENLHLFYRLRDSYGERRQLPDAPGMMFLAYEGADLATFVELALIFGWDFYLLPLERYGTAFVSHDEYLQLFTDDAEKADWARAWLKQYTNDSTPSALPAESGETEGK